MYRRVLQPSTFRSSRLLSTRAADFKPYQFSEDETLIQSMLPADQRAPLVLEKSLENGLQIYIGAATSLHKHRPGNGGFRLMEYPSEEKCIQECVGLAQGMAVKHSVFNTGFSGAKVVCNASNVEGGVASIDKDELMDATSALLRELDGVMYTGCDMNTTLDDMEYLADKCDYVLAAIQNPKVDPNACTAFGVVGAIEAAVGNVSGRTLVVHGCGNVGSIVAEEMARCGATVFTVDIDPARANIPGCINVSEGTPGALEHPHWWKIPCDALVPCSKSGLLNCNNVPELKTRVVVGATNLPFATNEAHQLTEDLGIQYIPELPLLPACFNFRF